MNKKLHLLFYIFAVITIIVSATLGITRYQFLNNAKLVPGVVSSVNELNYQQGVHDPSFWPVVTYITDSEGSYEIPSLVGSYDEEKEADRVGSPVTVYYSPHAPEKGVINGTWNLWGGAITFLIISILMLMGGIFAKPKTEQTGK